MLHFQQETIVPPGRYGRRVRLMVGVEEPASSLSFVKAPFALFPAFSVSTVSPACRPRSPVRVAAARPVRLCSAVLPGADDGEFFFCNNSSGSRTSSVAAAESNSLPTTTAGDAEEQFDFVRDADSPATPPIPPIAQPPPDVVHAAPSIVVDTVRPKTSTASDSSQPSRSQRGSLEKDVKSAGKTTEKIGIKGRAIRVLVPREMRGLAEQLGQETGRLFTESRVVPGMRMPTRRGAVLFAWDVALILSVLLLLRAGVAKVLRWIHTRLNATRGLPSNIPYEQSVFECMQRPLEFLSLFTVGTVLAEVVSRPLAATGLLRNILRIRELGMIISATWFLLRWIDRIRSRFAAEKRSDKAQVDATSRIATVVTFVAALLISLDTIGINVQTVLAFGGIGGVAIGFAGREIISNFFGGFMVYVTRPFSVGDWIRSIEERELNGTVEDIGWYLTRVRTWDKRPLYIPNSRFSTLIVENGSRMDNRRIVHWIQVRIEDMPVVPTIVSQFEELLMSHPELDPRQHRLAYMDSFGEYSVKIWVSCYTKSVFLYDFRRVQQDILVKCYDIIRTTGANLATINTRDVRPGTNTDRYGPTGSNATFGQSVASSEKPEGQKLQDYVNTDVPGSPEYGKTTPLVRFNTIESGVDFSKIGQPHAPSGVPVGSSSGTPVPPVPGAAVSAAEYQPVTVSGQDRASPKSASVAAVAVGAAALAAASKTRSTNNDEAESVSKTPDGNDANEVNVNRPDAQSLQSTPPGEMRISAAKPARHIPSMESPRSQRGIGGPDDGLERPQVQEFDRTRAESPESVVAPSMEQRSGASQEMKIMGVSPQQTAAGGSESSITSLSRGGQKGASSVEGLSSPSGQPAQGSNANGDEGSATPWPPAVHPSGGSTSASTAQPSNPQGEMKISKARKPIQFSQVGGDDDRPNIGQTSNSVGPTTQPDSSQNNGTGSTEKSSHEA